MTAPVPNPRLTAIVRQMRWEAQGIVSLELEANDGECFPRWEPGAHIDVTLPNSRVRQYSLCGPTAAAEYRIAVRRSDRSRGGSEYIHSFLRPGQRVHIGDVRNNFRIEGFPPYTFVAGGIGITAILPMVVRAAEAGVEWRLFYTGKSPTSMAFLNELERYGDRVRLHFSTENRMSVASIVDSTPPGSGIHACGPTRMLRDLLQYNDDADDYRAMHVEKFVASGPTSNAVDREHLVHCRRSGVSVRVPAGTSLLSALNAVGAAVPSSCGMGLCGTCEVPVLSGSPDHRDDVLTGPVRSRTDTMFVCVSRAITDELVLDI